MLKFFHFIVWLALWIGVGDTLIHNVLKLKESAIHAHRTDQISFEKFSLSLTSK